MSSFTLLENADKILLENGDALFLEEDIILIANIVSGPTRSRISRVPGRDSFDFVWESSDNFQAYQIRSVPAPDSLYTEGNLIEQNQNPAAGGTAGTDYTAVITDDEVVAADPGDEEKIIKIFVQDAAGNWSI